MKTYGSLIAEMRESFTPRMSRRKLSRKIGLSETHLRGIEADQRETKPIVLRRCAIALGIDEKPLLKAWLHQQLKDGHQATEIISQLPEGVEVCDLAKLYNIETAKFIAAQHQEKSGIEISNPKTAIELRCALQNCIGFINEIEKLIHPQRKKAS